MSEEMSKSAKKRAAAKARAANAAAAEEAAAPAPAPAPKAKAEPKAEAKAKPKADAKPKAEPKAEPKAKAKAEAKAKPEPKPEPKAEPKPAAKAAGKASAKKKAAAPAAEAPPPKPKEENTSHLQVDDGTGGDWEVATNVSKKAQRQKERKAEEARMTKQEKTIQQVNQHIPGAAPANAAVVVKSSAASQAVTATAVAAKTAEPSKEGAAEPAKEKLDTVTIKVPEKMIGRVIGPKGGNLKLIQEKTGIDRIDTSGDTFTISGKPGTTAAAHAALTELVEKGYMSLAFDNFAEIGCMAHPSTFPDIIGSKGATIIKLKEELKVEVSIPPVPKGQGGARKYRIGIAGSKEASEKAQKCIEDIIMYGHSEITHPGLVHEELEVPEWAYAFIIGKGGSELRHIQKNWSVRVNIPREHSENRNVVIVGEPRDVARAKEYIEKQVYAAENQSSGRDKADKAEDFWGDDDSEPWMDQYMYKRK